jgi:hypothetical protein
MDSTAESYIWMELWRFQQFENRIGSITEAVLRPT